jgi:hypothetical protein
MTMLAPAVETEQAHVVREGSGRVVLICWGADATGEATQWASKGYQVSTVAREVLGL